MWLSSTNREHLFDTMFRGALAVTLYATFPAFSDIHRLWRREAGLAIVGGLGPGEFEYPPVAALYFEPLSHLPSSRWAVVVNGIVMVVAAVGVTWLLLRAIDEAGTTDSSDIRIWAMSPSLLLFLPVNWDVAVAYLALSAVIALYSQRVTTSGMLLAVGTSLKVFPGALLLPALPLITGWKKRLRFIGTGLALLAASYLAYVLIRPSTWAIHLDFAASREDFGSTLWGLIDSLVSLFGLSLSLDSVNLLSTGSVIAALVALTLWALVRRPTFAQIAALAVIALLVFNKVFKPQYVLWVLPFLAWNGSDRSTVRVIELAAIVQFAAIYFGLPSALGQLAAIVRIGGLLGVGRAIMRRASAGLAPIRSYVGNR